MVNIITFGSASLDVFLKSKKFTSRKGICFDVGSKADFEDIYFSSGGGGTNTAATFRNQGFNVVFYGVVGTDIFGKAVIKDLRKRKIKTRFIKKIKERPTNFSVILTSAGKDRTVLAYRGASEELSFDNVSWQKLKADWFYLAPLSGRAAGLTEKIVDFAKKNKIKIVLNPGNSQLSLRSIKKIIKKVDILILNQEEASLLTKVPYNREKEIFKKIDKICPGIAVMTKGAKGAVVSDGERLFRAKVPKARVADKTGAGDAFGSGFVSGFIKSKGDIEFAIHLATANATSCIKKIGAKEGLLKNSIL